MSFIVMKSLIILSRQKNKFSESDGVYNTKRPHLSCSMLTPAQMHQQNLLPVKYWHKKTSPSSGEVH